MLVGDAKVRCSAECSCGFSQKMDGSYLRTYDNFPPLLVVHKVVSHGPFILYRNRFLFVTHHCFLVWCCYGCLTLSHHVAYRSTLAASSHPVGYILIE